MIRRVRLGLLCLLAGCGAGESVPPKDLVGLLAVDRALALCGVRKGPRPCEVHDSVRNYVIAYDSTGRVCAYREIHLIPLVQWDSAYRAALATFHGRLGASETDGSRFRQWTRQGFTAFVTGERADGDSLAPADTVGAVIAGYYLPKARRCRRPSSSPSDGS